MKYTIHDLNEDFKTDAECLAWLIDWLYPNGITCKKCQQVTKHYPITGRKTYSCGVCRSQISPMKGTILAHTHISLKSWFYAIYQMATNKAGTPAKQIQRELGITYKTAWRMMHQIRKLMEPKEKPLQGEVEIDETYVHANVYKRSSAQKRYGQTGQRAGQVLFGIVERGGHVKVFHVKAPGERILIPLIRQHIQGGSLIHSDGYRAYKKLPNWGYMHRTTNHSAHEFYREDSYTQNIENVWSHFKRGIKGIYRHVDNKYLQVYANEYAFRYSHRNKPNLYWSLMCQLG